MKNVRLYARVSTDEQKKKDSSIPVQLEILRKYCEENDYKIMDIYIDNGISASAITKRKAWLKLMDDVKPNESVLITRLDRFSRNVLDANIFIKQFAENNVSLETVLEDDIDTSSADGKFMFDLRVSLAERERKKDSERILDVFNSKLKRGELLTGSLPLGYKIQDKKPVIDDVKADIVKKIFESYIDTGNYSLTAKIIENEFGITMSPTSIISIISNEKYIGLYRGFDNYFPPIISKEIFYEAKKVKQTRYVKKSKNNEDYLFPGLLRCAECGNRMASSFKKRNKSNKHYYVCIKRKNCRTIQHFSKSEKKIERILLNELEQVFKNEIANIELQQTKKAKSNSYNQISTIKSKISRLKNLYIDGVIEKEEFDKKYNDLNKQIDSITIEPTTDDLSKKKQIYQEYIDGNVLEIYETFSRKQKAIFWRGILDHVIVHKDDTLDIFLK